jgi:hypothetical protein
MTSEAAILMQMFILDSINANFLNDRHATNEITNIADWRFAVEQKMQLVDLPKNTIVRFATINDEKMFPTTKLSKKLLKAELERISRASKRAHH